MKHNRPLKAIFTTAALAAALTGCGSDSDSTDTTDIDDKITPVAECVDGTANTDAVYTFFADGVACGWAAWGEGGQLPAAGMDNDSAYGDVYDFANKVGGIFDAGKTVNGFSASLLKQGLGESFDATAYRDAGSIQFDLKMTVAPPATDVWYFKVESSTGQPGGQEFIIDTPVLDTWVHYVIPLNLISEENVADLINLMVFPKWGDNEGAEFSIDNLVITEDTPFLDLRTPLAGDVVLFADDLADGWGIWQNSNGEGAAAIAAMQDDELGAVVGLTSIGEEVAGITTLSAKVAGLPNTPLDLSAFMDGGSLHFDIKLTADTAVPFDNWIVKVEGAAAGEVSFPAPVLDTWVHYVVPVTAFGDMSAVNNVMFFPAWSADAAGAAYLVDNITFSSEAPPAPEVVVTVPTAAAISPVVADGDVFVIYSDSNTVDQAILEYQTWWNPPVQTEETIEGNNFYKFTMTADGGSGGLVFGTAAAPIDVSAYTGIRFDMFVEETVGNAQFKMVDTSTPPGEGINIPVTGKGAWESVEIPFTAFTVGAVGTIDTSSLGTMGVIMTGTTPGAAIYIDNMYFY